MDTPHWKANCLRHHATLLRLLSGALNTPLSKVQGNLKSPKAMIARGLQLEMMKAIRLTTSLVNPRISNRLYWIGRQKNHD